MWAGAGGDPGYLRHTSLLYLPLDSDIVAGIVMGRMFTLPSLSPAHMEVRRTVSALVHTEVSSRTGWCHCESQGDISGVAV